MNRVPLLVTTLCRYQHFKNCIESLAANILADQTDLYIGLDYPAKESHWEGYRKVKEYIANGIDGFANVYCFEQTQNAGWYGNFVFVRNKIYENYDCFIYSEDDNIFSPYFLNYMNLCMDKYKDDETVYAVSGYNYPVGKNLYQGNVYKSKVYFSASGYGTWKSKESKMYSKISIEKFRTLLNNREYVKSLRNTSKNQFCNYIRGMTEYKSELIVKGDVQKIDLAFGVQMLADNIAMIFPTVSLVRNCGYDGSGMNCSLINHKKNSKENHRNYNYDSQPIDNMTNWSYLSCLNKEETLYMNKLVNQFFKVEKLEYIKTVFCYWGINVLGLEKVKKIIHHMM